MTRGEIRAQVRTLALVEDINVSDNEIISLTNEALHFLEGYYPFSMTIGDLVLDTDSPTFNESFHWLIVEWVLAQVYKREEYFDIASEHEARFEAGVRQLIKFYTGGRT